MSAAQTSAPEALRAAYLASRVPHDAAMRAERWNEGHELWKTCADLHRAYVAACNAAGIESEAP